MATKYVWSGASGSNDGSSWANAWTSLASSNGVAAGDVVKVHKTHSQTTLTNTIAWSNGTISNPVRIVCVDKDNSDAVTTGAIVQWSTSNRGPSGNIIASGITFTNSSNILLITIPTDGIMHLEDCSLKVLGGTGFSFSQTRGTAVFRNVTLDSSGASAAGVGMFSFPSRLEWIGGEYILRSPQTRAFNSATFPAMCDISSVTFTGTVTDIFSFGANSSGEARLRNCLLPSYTNVVASEGDGSTWMVILDCCQPGTLTTASLSPTSILRRGGSVTTSLSRYRNGGAEDMSQSNPYSWEVVSTAKAAFSSPFSLPPIVRWVESGPQVVSVYVASGSTLTDAELWAEVVSPSEAVSADSLGQVNLTRCQTHGTPATLTTDGTSVWNGTGVGTKQKIDVSINPTIPGPVVLRLYFAKASTTIYVDPQLEVS